jgi:polyisoprenyl-teichoic acid--peptidoglycan teichoic acid transferase
MVFKKRYILIPFFLIVLVVGIFLGSRFVRFASSVSTSEEGAVSAIRNTIGATLGNTLPSLKKLDKTKIAQAISEGKSVNILLLGYGGGSHSGTYLTDSIIVLHLDFYKDQATIIPVPRDLWVQIPVNGYNGSFAKINAAYAYGMDDKGYPDKLPRFTGERGAGNLSKYVASVVTGLHIDYYASIDFDGFKEIVDALGGVDINVENAFTDYTYPNGEENVNGWDCTASIQNPDSGCKYKKVHFDKGLQHMDGDTALEYVRSRHAAGVEGSDFARSRRQQLLIAAIEDKALSLGVVPHILDLMDSIQNHFMTDLSFAEIKDLVSYSENIDLDQANQISLTDSSAGLLINSFSSDGQWILLPEKGSGDYSDIRKYISDNLKQ